MLVTVERVRIPRSIDSDDAADFIGFVDVGNDCALHLWRSDDFVHDAADELSWYGDSPFQLRMLYLARVDGEPAARVLVTVPLDPASTTAELDVRVIPAARRHGIGTALLQQGEDLVADAGRIEISMFSEHPAAGIRSRPDHESVDGNDDGSGDGPELPRDEAVGFARHHGYRLGQVQLMSRLALPLDADRRTRLLEDAAARSHGYTVRTWFGRCPDALVEGYALAASRMSTDAPHDGLVMDATPWDARRVREMEQRAIGRGRPRLTTAALSGDGRLVGYSELEVVDASRVAEQRDTIVLPEHRGHGLGLLMKIANLDRLAAAAPGTTGVITWTVEDNGAMRAINDALGFQMIALIGDWQKSIG